MSGPPADAEPRISLEDHARITARIAEGDRPTREVLEAEGLDETEWNAVTGHWMKALGDDATLRGADATLIHVYSAAFSKAQDALRPVPAMTPEEWAALTAEILKAGGPARPLAARALSKADYIRLSRHWAGVLSHDAKQNKRYFETFVALTKEPEA